MSRQVLGWLILALLLAIAFAPGWMEMIKEIRRRK